MLGPGNDKKQGNDTVSFKEHIKAETEKHNCKNIGNSELKY